MFKNIFSSHRVYVQHENTPVNTIPIPKSHGKSVWISKRLTPAHDDNRSWTLFTGQWLVNATCLEPVFLSEGSHVTCHQGAFTHCFIHVLFLDVVLHLVHIRSLFDLRSKLWSRGMVNVVSKPCKELWGVR